MMDAMVVTAALRRLMRMMSLMGTKKPAPCEGGVWLIQFWAGPLLTGITKAQPHHDGRGLVSPPTPNDTMIP
jgi:hypothetical protein